MIRLTGKRTATIVAGALTVALVVCVASAALAQPGPQNRPERRALQAYLHGLKQCDVSTDQHNKIKGILETSKETMRTLAESRKANAAALKAAMDTARPDPTAIGNALLKLKNSREAIKSERKKVHDAVLVVLTPEQRTRFEGYLAGLRLAARHRLCRRPAGAN
jgi:Spy/CpxP family protein refolding chaperone